MSWDIAILGHAGSRKEPEPVRVHGVLATITPVDEDEEGQIMREDW